MAVDGISFRAIANNKFIRELMERVHFRLPVNESHIANLVHKETEIKKAEVMAGLQKKRGAGAKFSLSVDEVTSVRNRRYFSINLHDSDEKSDINLGMVRIFASSPAVKMAEDVIKHVESFGVVFNEDIVASTHDGAPVTVKYGREILPLSQLCFNHAIHLAVCDTLFKKPVKATDTEPAA